MSGNINDTNTDSIKRDIDNFIQDIKDNTECDFKQKYKNLYNTSKTLYTMIDVTVRKDISLGSFSLENFKTRIDKFLLLISQIQSGNVSQHDASVIVGKDVANEFIKLKM